MMALVAAKPTSPGRRFVVKVQSPELYKGTPYKPLLEPLHKTGGAKFQRANHDASPRWRA